MEDGKIYGSENRRKLYDNLIKDGFDLGSLEDFNRNMDDKNTRRAIYEAAQGAGWEVPEYDQFDRDMTVRRLKIGGESQEVDHATYDDFLKRHPSGTNVKPKPQQQSSVQSKPQQTAKPAAQPTNTPQATQAPQIPVSTQPWVDQDGRVHGDLFKNDPVNKDASQFGFPYKPDTQMTVAQLDEVRRQNDFTARQLQKEAREQRRRNQPFVDTGSPQANEHIIKTQGEWDDDLQKGASRISSSVVAPAVDKAIADFDKKAHDVFVEGTDKSNAMGGLPTGTAGGAGIFGNIKEANKAKDPEKILNYLKSQMEGLYKDQNFIDEVGKEADKMGIDRSEYLEQVIKPQIESDLVKRFDGTMIARYLPKNQMEYIVGGLSNSIIGMLFNAFTETKGERAYKNQAEAMTEEGQNPNFQPGTAARLAKMGVSFAADAPFFGLYGKVSGTVAKKVAERQIQNLTAKGLSEGAARSIVGTALENSVGARMKNYLMQHIISSSMTLGGYNATSEFARQTRDKEGYDLGKIAGSTAEGMATGAAFGLTGGVAQALSQPLSGIAKVGAKLGSFGAEAETLYATEELAKMAQGEEGFENPFEGSVEALMKLGVMKASGGHLIGKAGEKILRAKEVGVKQAAAETAAGILGRQRTGVNFTPEEQAYIRNSVEGKNLVESLSAMHPELSIEEVNGKKRLTKEGEQQRRQLSDNYERFMTNTEIPAIVKQKVASMLGGVYRPGLETGSDIIHNPDGSVILKTRDKDGNCVRDLKFDSFSDAEQFRDTNMDEFRMNDAINMWNATTLDKRVAVAREVAEMYGLGPEEAVDMVSRALNPKDTSLDKEQYDAVFGAIERNAYPADELNVKRRYWEGQQLSPEERHFALVDKQVAEEKLALLGQDFADEVIGAADYPDEKMAELAGRKDITGEQLEAAVDYYNKSAVVNGMMEEALKNVDSQVEAANAYVQRNTHPDTGAMIEATAKGRNVYVTAGHFQLTPDGKIEMTDNSGMVIVRDKDTGEIEVVSPQDVLITGIRDPKQMMAYNDSMDGLRGELMRKTDDSIELNPETPQTPLEEDYFIGSDGKRYVTMQTFDESGNPVWMKMEVGEDGIAKGDATSLDIAEYRKAKSNEIDAANRPVEEVLEQPVPENAEMGTDAAEPVPEGQINGQINDQNKQSDAINPSDNQQEVKGSENGQQQSASESFEKEISAKYRIPLNENAEPDYEKAKPEDSYDALVEEFGEDYATALINSEISDAQRRIPKPRPAESITIPNGLSMAEKARLVKQQMDRQKAQQEEDRQATEKEQAKVDYWTSVLEIPKTRKTEAERAARLEKMQTPEGRAELLSGAKNTQERAQIAKEIYGDYFNEHVEEPETAEELVSLLLPYGKLNWEGYERGTSHVRGLQEELGSQHTRGLSKDRGTSGFNSYLAKKGEGESLDDIVHDMYIDNANISGEEHRFTTEEIKDAVIGMLLSAEKPTDIRDYSINSRIERAEKALRGELEHEADASEAVALEETVSEEPIQAVSKMPFEAPDDGVVPFMKASTDDNSRQHMVETRSPDDSQPESPERREQMMRDAVVNHLREAGIEVSTDWKEGQRILDEYNSSGLVKKMGSRVDSKKADLSSELEDKEMNEAQQAVADVYTGKKDNAVITVSRDGQDLAVTMRQGNENKAGTKHSLFRHYDTGVGVITADDVLRIPEVLANGERTEKQRGNVKLAQYRLTDESGKRYTVVTEIKNSGEVFNDFYTNKKASNQTPQMPNGDTPEGARTNDLNASGAKVQQNPETTKNSEIKLFKTPDGYAYGYTYEGKIYLDPRIATSETPIHEYSHLWAEMKRNQDPDEWDHIKNVMLNDRLVKPIIDRVRRDYVELTKEGKEDDFVEEVITQFSGKRGSERLREIADEIAAENGGVFGKAEALTAMQRLKNILNRFWEGVAKMMGWKYTNANQIADRILSDMLNGVNPREHMKEVSDKIRDMRAYHGSAAEFDRFDHSKIGSGEGQAVSGHGTYVTTSEGTARYYANVASERQRKVVQEGGYTLNGNVVRDPALVRAADYLKKADGNVDEAIKACEHTIEVLNRHKDKNPFAALRGSGKSVAEEALDYLHQEKDNPGAIGYQEEIIEKPDRQLYEVEIPDDTGKNYLDLDKKLTKAQKEKFRKAFIEALDKSEDADYWKKNRDIVDYDWKQVEASDAIGDTVRGVMEQFLPSEEVSKIFSDMGYVGSKTKGSDGTTYIIYNDGDLQINDRMKFQMVGRNGAVKTDEAENGVERDTIPENQEKSSPIGRTSSPEIVSAEESRVNTNPTEGQKKAGNYQKGHINVDGYDITIENPKGSVRSGVDSKGNRWETTMRNTYGYIRGTEGVDGDHIDVFLSDDPTSGKVFVVDQVNPETGAFDEHKIMYSFSSEEEAREAYLANYAEGWQGLGAITEVSREEFKKWVESSHRKTKPFAEYKSVKANQPRFQRVSNPEPELTPEERQYWNKWDADMKKWRERNAIPEGIDGPGEKPKFRQGELYTDYGVRLTKWMRDRKIWQTAPKLEDYRQRREDKDLLEAARENEQRYPDSPSAKMRRVAAEFQQIRRAMSQQKAYDKATVKAVTGFAQEFMKQGFGDNLSRGEMERMLSSVKNATGAKDIRQQIDNIMNILVDNQLRNLDQRVQKLSSTKELSKTAQGVEKQGKLELKGQRMIQAFRKAREERMTPEKIRERLHEVAEMARNDDEAPMWEQEYEGLSIALQYAENIEGSREEYMDLDRAYKDAVESYKTSGRSYKAQQQLLESIDQARMENKIERIGLFGDIIGRLEGNIAESMEGAKEFVQREKDRVKHIQQIANFDLAGKNMGAIRESTKGKPANFFLQPLGTFEQMLRQFGSRNANGEGYLFDHFIRKWMDATDQAYVNELKAKEELDTKAREVFGDKVKRWSDLYQVVRDLPTMDVEVLDGEDPKTFTLNQGNLLYIYMADKMTDGRMKLRKMGIEEEDVQAIKDFLDPRLVELGDWLQDDYLVKKRTEYNKVHERMFGAPMAAIDHYFPLRILGDARVQEQDVANMADQDAVLPSTITGNIIKRRKNALPLDILHTDALSLAIEHIEDMEKWAATAEWNKDINTLLSYTTFRNKVKNMKTIYGSGDALWNTFADTARMAAGTYMPKAKPGSVDATISNIAKGVTAAKISFRIYTAFKQILSAPAFLHDVNLADFAKYSVNPYGSWKWAMENMPVFKKRWKSRQVGDTRLMDDPTDWKMWKTNIVKMASMMGMSPNALVDGVTCAVGARAIYDARYRKYKKIGATDEVARKRALQDAEIGYNLTQQSSEGAFVSRIQKDRTVAANMLSVFRNSSMAYTRQWVDAARNLKHRMQPGYKEDSIKFMTKQFEEQFDLDEAQAKKAAEAEYARAGRRDVARLLNMMFGVTMAWNLGASLPYLLLGDDDETKKEMMTDALIRAMVAGPTEGMAAGNLWSELMSRSLASEETRNTVRKEGWGAGVDSALKQGGDYEVNPLPLMADIQGMIKKMGYDKFAAAQDVFNIVAQSAVGVNPQTFTDMWNAIMDYAAPGWDGHSYNPDDENFKRPKELALFMMRLLNAPTSSWRNKYIDELGMNAEDAKKLPYEEMAKRYAHYKHWKDAPIMGWLRGEEGRAAKMEKIQKQFDKAVEERMQRLSDKELESNIFRSQSTEEKRKYAKIAAQRLGLTPANNGDSKKADDSHWYQELYQQHMLYEDIKEDETLAAKMKDLRDDEAKKEINKRLDWIRDGKYDTESGRKGKRKKGNEPSLIAPGKKQLANDEKQNVEDILKNIRKWRKEALEIALKPESENK